MSGQPGSSACLPGCPWLRGLSCANEPELLPTCPGHLRVSASVWGKKGFVMPAVRWSTTMIAVAATVLGALVGAARAATVTPDLRAAAVTGTWGTAQEVPGTANLNRGGDATVNSVSCASAGTCAAGGYYTDGSGNQQAFVASQVYGTWHTAVEVPATAALNRGGDAEVLSVSCASAGNCSAGGYYVDASSHWQAFVANEVHG